MNLPQDDKIVIATILVIIYLYIKGKADLNDKE